MHMSIMSIMDKPCTVRHTSKKQLNISTVLQLYFVPTLVHSWTICALHKSYSYCRAHIQQVCTTVVSNYFQKLLEKWSGTRWRNLWAPWIRPLILKYSACPGALWESATEDRRRTGRPVPSLCPTRTRVTLEMVIIGGETRNIATRYIGEHSIVWMLCRWIAQTIVVIPPIHSDKWPFRYRRPLNKTISNIHILLLLRCNGLISPPF